MLFKEPEVSRRLSLAPLVVTEMLLNEKTEEELKAFKNFNLYKPLGEPEGIVLVLVDAAIARGKWLSGAGGSVERDVGTKVITLTRI
jgi:hypothetical protein